MDGVLFPLDPAFHFVRRATDDEDVGRTNRLAGRLGVHHRTLLKWKEAGGVDVWTADFIATRLQVDADDLWPGWSDVADAAAAAVPEQLDIFDVFEAAS